MVRIGRAARGALAAPFRLAATVGEYRFLLLQLARRGFAVRHAGNYLGWLWTPLSTIVQFALFMVVFSMIMEIKIQGLGIDLARRPPVGFGVYLITGLVPFLALNDAVLRAARVFRAHVNLVQRVRFPAEVLVLGDVLGALLHHVVALLLVVGLCAALGHLGLVGLPWLAAGLLLLALWIAGLSLVASVVGALLPDITEALALVLQVAFYAAPIVYPLAMVENPAVRSLVELNPLTPLVGVLRAGLLGADPPSVGAVTALGVVGLALVWGGAVALERARTRIPDLL